MACESFNFISLLKLCLSAIWVVWSNNKLHHCLWSSPLFEVKAEVLVTRHECGFIGCIDFIDVRNRSFVVASILIMYPLSAQFEMNGRKYWRSSVIINVRKMRSADPWCGSDDSNAEIFSVNVIPLYWAWIMRAMETWFNCNMPTIHRYCNRCDALDSDKLLQVTHFDCIITFLWTKDDFVFIWTRHVNSHQNHLQ